MSRVLRLLPLVSFLCLLLVRPAGAEISVVDGGIKFTYVNGAAASVAWAGAFNNWSSSANVMTKDGDTFSIVLALPPGEHEYKFVVDGQWVADPENTATRGEYGNSLLKLGADGKIQSMQATSNTAMNPKILAGGRFTTYFITRRNVESDKRYELRRPDFDLDLDFNIRMSDVLDARMLTNIRSQTEDFQFFRSRLNFDRGSLHLHSNQIDLYAFDNDRVESWEDPLHLVGDVGIYGHDFGYVQQGMQARRVFSGFDARLLYADNFRPGGTGRPTLVTANANPQAEVLSDSDRRLDTLGRYVASDTDNEKDILAGRVLRQLRPGLRLGVSGRLDRGQNAGSVVLQQTQRYISGADTSTAVSTYNGPTLERWWGVGGDVEWKNGGWTTALEYLYGRNQFEVVGLNDRGTTVSGSPTTVRPDPLETDGFFDLATDHRLHLGASGEWRKFSLDVSFQYHGTEVTPLGNDSLITLDNSMSTVALRASREVRLLGRPIQAALGFEYNAFSYTKGTPWRNQFWFDRNNFWLEAGEHEVRFDRIAVLGGDDAITWKPEFSLSLWSRRELTFRYAGTFSGVSLDTRPKFSESLFQFNMKTGSKTRLYSDTRWAKYADPVLNLNHGYVSTWLEGSYDFTPSIYMSLGLGVDPNVIDEPVNEFAYIGRDSFLFERGANGANAQNNYFGLTNIVHAAERALELERRVQLKGVVRF